MLSQLRPAFVMLALFTGLTGLIYPLTFTALAQLVLPGLANGSVVRQGEQVVGSELIGQAFASDKYFHSRPSAAGDGYNAAASSGSNLGPTSQKLLDRVKTDTDAIRKATSTAIPADAVTASASGLDPHISPANAEMQIARIAAARGVSEEQVKAIVAAATASPTFGLIGEPRINVLNLNLTLDQTLAGRSG